MVVFFKKVKSTLRRTSFCPLRFDREAKEKPHIGGSG